MTKSLQECKYTPIRPNFEQSFALMCYKWSPGGLRLTDRIALAFTSDGGACAASMWASELTNTCTHTYTHCAAVAIRKDDKRDNSSWPGGPQLLPHKGENWERKCEDGVKKHHLMESTSHCSLVPCQQLHTLMWI